MKIALIADTHFGARNENSALIRHTTNFFQDTTRGSFGNLFGSFWEPNLGPEHFQLSTNNCSLFMRFLIMFGLILGADWDATILPKWVDCWMYV